MQSRCVQRYKPPFSVSRCAPNYKPPSNRSTWRSHRPQNLFCCSQTGSMAGTWHWQQTMLRIKDPTASVQFYTEKFGMTLLAHLQFPEWKFDLFFLTTLPEGAEYTLDPQSKEAADYCFSGDYAGHHNVTLELTHNYGTELQDEAVYHPGNAMECEALGTNGRDGFGHIAFNVDDVYAACDSLEAQGCTFKKKPDEVSPTPCHAGACLRVLM